MGATCQFVPFLCGGIGALSNNYCIVDTLNFVNTIREKFESTIRGNKMDSHGKSTIKILPRCFSYPNLTYSS